MRRRLVVQAAQGQRAALCDRLVCRGRNRCRRRRIRPRNRAVRRSRARRPGRRARSPRRRAMAVLRNRIGVSPREWIGIAVTNRPPQSRSPRAAGRSRRAGSRAGSGHSRAWLARARPARGSGCGCPAGAGPAWPGCGRRQRRCGRGRRRNSSAAYCPWRPRHRRRPCWPSRAPLREEAEQLAAHRLDRASEIRHSLRRGRAARRSPRAGPRRRFGRSVRPLASGSEHAQRAAMGRQCLDIEDAQAMAREDALTASSDR